MPAKVFLLIQFRGEEPIGVVAVPAPSLQWALSMIDLIGEQMPGDHFEYAWTIDPSNVR